MDCEYVFDLMKGILPKGNGWMSEKEIIERVKGVAEEEVDAKEIETLVRKVLRDEVRDGIISKGARKCKFGATGYRIRVRNVRMATTTIKPETDAENKHYTGKGAEYAVLAELMYSGYNANLMAVDEGIDIVASKNNIFYYIQVKSTHFDKTSKRFNYSIPVENFERVKANNVIYVVVVRGDCVGQFTFFKFSQSDILNNITNGYINRTESNININVQYDEIEHRPYLVNGTKKTVAASYENNFEL